MRKIIRFVILLPLLVLLLVFALANRVAVTIIFDPFGLTEPPLSFTAPLFVLLFITLALGVFLGGIAMWFSEGRHRRAARIHLRDLEKHQREINELRREQNLPPLPPATLIG